MTAGWVAGVPGLTPRDASAAVALVTAATEPHYETVGFFTGKRGWKSGKGPVGLRPAGPDALAFSPRQRLDDVVKTVSDLPFGGTDCALPMLYARAQVDDERVDLALPGRAASTQAAVDPRRLPVIAQSLGLGMISTGFSIADPGMLDVVGFDTATPQLITDFARGTL